MESLQGQISDPQAFVKRIEEKLKELGSDEVGSEDVFSLAEYSLSLHSMGKSVEEVESDLSEVIANGGAFAKWVFKYIDDDKSVGVAVKNASEADKSSRKRQFDSQGDHGVAGEENASSAAKASKQFKPNKIVWDLPDSSTTKEKLKSANSSSDRSKKDVRQSKFGLADPKANGRPVSVAAPERKTLSIVGAAKGAGGSIGSRLGPRTALGDADGSEGALKNHGQSESLKRGIDATGQQSSTQPESGGNIRNQPYGRPNNNGRLPPKRQEEFLQGVAPNSVPEGAQIVQQFGVDQFGNIIPLGGPLVSSGHNGSGYYNERQQYGGMRGGFQRGRRGRAGNNFQHQYPPVPATTLPSTTPSSELPLGKNANNSESGESEIIMDSVGSNVDTPSSVVEAGKTQSAPFIQPCYYGNNCSRPDCKFSHPWQSSSTVQCRFWPNCLNPICTFYHPPDGTAALVQKTDISKIPCKYEPYCANPNCMFKHQKSNSGGNMSVVFNKPAGTHVSDRAFAAEGDVEKVLPETSEVPAASDDK